MTGRPDNPDRKRVLVIDDDPAICQMLADALGDEGYAVLTAEDGADGLRRARDWRPHVILCDLVMPRMNGFEFVRNYRQTPGPHAALFVMTAAGATARAAVEALSADEFFPKPFEVTRLLESVAHHAHLPAA